MLENIQPAPIGFVKEFLVVANNLTMKEVQFTDGHLIFLPKHNRSRDAYGMMRRLARRLHLTDLVDYSRRFGICHFAIDQERLGQLIDLRGWPEVTRNVLNVNMNVWKDKELGWVCDMEIDCEEYSD